MGLTGYPETPEQYTAAGWRIFPVTIGAKTPLVKEWQKGAPIDGPFNIGLVTGEASGLVVLDIDAHKGGYDSLKELENRFGVLPPTLSSITANGGSHHFFQRPSRAVPNGTGIYGLSGVDIRGDGGYVVVPPSSLDSNRKYQWDVGSPVSLALLPEWIAGHRDARSHSLSIPDTTKNPPGTHHEYLVKVAGSLRRLGIPQDLLEKMLLAANLEKNAPPCPEREVLDLARDASKRWSQGYTPPQQPKRMAMTATDFMSVQATPPAMLIHNIWPEDSIGFVAGPPKAFKSFFTLEMAYSVASGGLFLGRFKVPEPRRVLLIQQESSIGAFQVRLGNIVKRMGETDNLFIISNRHISLEDEVDLEKFESEIVGINPALVILDPLASFIRGDENSAQAMGEVIRSLRRIRDDCKTGVCVVHHTTKSSGRQMRGSSALYGAAEAMLYINRTEDRDALKSRVDVELKESEGHEPFYVTLDPDTTALEIERTYVAEQRYEQDHWDGLGEG